MTIAEVQRAIDSKIRVKQRQDQEKASFDYILANLIGKSLGRLFSSSSEFPTIAEAYPSLFDSQKTAEEEQARRDELSALRFKQFAQSFNEKFNKEVGKD